MKYQNQLDQSVNGRDRLSRDTLSSNLHLPGRCSYRSLCSQHISRYLSRSELLSQKRLQPVLAARQEPSSFTVNSAECSSLSDLQARKSSSWRHAIKIACGRYVSIIRSQIIIGPHTSCTASYRQTTTATCTLRYPWGSQHYNSSKCFKYFNTCTQLNPFHDECAILHRQVLEGPPLRNTWFAQE